MTRTKIEKPTAIVSYELERKQEIDLWLTGARRECALHLASSLCEIGTGATKMIGRCIIKGPHI